MVFDPVTRTVSVEPASAAVTVYVFPVAPLISVEPRSHWYVKLSGTGTQVPSTALNTSPIANFPPIIGVPGTNVPTAIVTVSAEGTIGSRTFFAIEGDTLRVMAISERELLQTPVPVMKVGTGRIRWEFTEDSPVSPKLSKLTVAAESTPKGKRRVLGVARETLEVKFSTESRKGDPYFKMNQTVLYAAGIGMIELVEESTFIKRTSKQTLTLTKFIGPKQAG